MASERTRRARRAAKRAAWRAKYGSAPARTSTSYYRRWRQQRGRGSDGERWARFELQLGRFAQGASLACGLVLGLTAFVTSILSDNLPIVSSFRRPDMALWLPLLATSFGVAGFTVAKKLGPYRQGWSGHLASSIVAFAVSIAFLGVALLYHVSIVDLGEWALWMYPGSVLGLALAFVSLALTWEGYGWRKGATIAVSLAVPASLALVPVVGTDPQGLILVYTYDALFVVFAGSLLHLIASSGEASQRAILKASGAKMAILKHEVAGRLKALEYREKAYVEREAHLEAKERHLLEQEAEVTARGNELNAAQAKLDKHGHGLSDLRARLEKMRAEVEAKVEQLNLKEADLKSVGSRAKEAARALAAREQAIAARDKEVKRAQIDVSSRQRGLEAKAQQLAEHESRLQAHDDAIEARRDEVIQKQKELELKESEVRLKIEQLGARQAKKTKERIGELQAWESKVLAKERDVAQLEVQLRSAKEEIAQRASEAEATAASLRQEREALEARERGLVAREKRVSDQEAAVGDRMQEGDRRWKEAVETERRLEERDAKYTALFREVRFREADLKAKEEELNRSEIALDAREAKHAEWQANLSEETGNLQERYRELLGREKAMQAKESDLSLKELEVTTREREADEAGPEEGTVDVDREQYQEMAEKRLKEREAAWKRRTYQKEKELEAREMAVREQLRAVAPEGEGTEAVEVVVAAGDKVATGTPRLDDLLYGGVPMNANVLFVGPAFVGKEVAILNFLAEGLRNNVPAVIVTTSKPPVEIAKEMAPVLPTFLEYERLDLVRWIDASGTTPTEGMAREGDSYRVPDAADFEDILAALDEADEEFRQKEAPYFRFAFLTLSSSLTQADEKGALAFVQRLVNRLRQSKCVAAFALERGMHTDVQVESLQQLMDGAVHFKQEKAKTLLSVVGIGETQTREWVPYKFTNKALMIGSFQLERIR